MPLPLSPGGALGGSPPDLTRLRKCLLCCSHLGRSARLARTGQQAEALLAQDCVRLQGFLYSRPVPGLVLPGTAAALRDRLAMAQTEQRVVPGARRPVCQIALPT